MKYRVQVQDKSFLIEISEKQNQLEVNLEGKKFQAEFLPLKNNNHFSLLLGNKFQDVEIDKSDGVYTVFVRGQKFECLIEEERFSKLTRLTGSVVTPVAESAKRTGGPADSYGGKELKAPMPGLIVELKVKKKNKVKAGQGVLVMEAMKMENEIRSHIEGTVKEILVKEKQVVEKDQLLLRFE